MTRRISGGGVTGTHGTHGTRGMHGSADADGAKRGFKRPLPIEPGVIGRVNKRHSAADVSDEDLSNNLDQHPTNTELAFLQVSAACLCFSSSFFHFFFHHICRKKTRRCEEIWWRRRDS